MSVYGENIIESDIKSLKNGRFKIRLKEKILLGNEAKAWFSSSAFLTEPKLF